ncbi:MAG: hypothetical protein NW223_01160 [Hyphomicrobiaceae bacterium]|nr:hypothetical protein [Hyphomicrobiaceae bacterium]
MKALLIALALAATGLGLGLGDRPPASAQETAGQDAVRELNAKLSPEQRKTYAAYTRARGQFDLGLKSYWASVDAKREVRRNKYRAGQPFAAQDYVAEQPPKYAGPELPADIQRIIAALKTPLPSSEPPPLPTVADILAHAREQYGFVPTPTTEAEFKRSYAREALRLGLSKDQVVRVYALETGGLGTYDMQSGINPLTRTGKPISSALGYAQLLHANSTSELVRHGDDFISRLQALAAATSVAPERARDLRAKAAVLRKMLRAARSIPNEWYAHVRFGGTAAGLGIHALNLDADVGPWLQVLKLKGLKDDAERAGRASLSGAELELMNLAGPRTGLEMMTPLAQAMPTANFFSQGGYYRNGIVRERTAAELMAALESRMEGNLRKAGSIEFAQIFDELQKPR